jgi:diguanylate cyclase (GGDEF)-like protein
MSLDIRTVVFTLMVSAVLMTLTLAFGLRAGSRAGFGKWNLGLATYAFGWLLIAARPALPDAIGVALADALLLAGLCLQLGALLDFEGRHAPAWLYVAPPAALFAVLLPLLDDYAALTAVASAAFAAALGALAVRTARLDRCGAGPVRWLMSGLLAAGAVGVAARAIDIAALPGATPQMFAGSTLHAASFLVLFAVTVTTSFGFVVLHRERAEEALRRLTLFDALTGVFARGALMELAAREHARARRAGTPCGFLMLDLDQFKRVNDDFGHQAGDRVLAEFAARVRGALRASDIVGRYGGEEFCVVLPATGLDKAREIAERIRAAVAATPMGGLPRATTVSIGLTQCAGAEDRLDDAIARADRALYEAKRAGRNRVADLEAAPAIRCAA